MASVVDETKKYLSLIKFSHTVFALPFAIIGFVLAMAHTAQPFSLKLFLLMLVCMVLARSAAMAFNRWADRAIDAQNARTAIREIPAGLIAANKALAMVIVCSAGFVLATYFINPLCFMLSPIALAVVLGYSYTKRFTALCHLVLGVGLALAPIGAYLTVTGQFALLPLLFSFAVLFWVSGFDIIYALQDEEFDRTNNLNSIPAWLGKSRALLVSRILHVCSAGFIVAAGFVGQFGYWYWAAAAVFMGLLVRQHTLVSPTNLSKVNLAFFTTNGIASVVFGVLVVIDLVLR